MVPVYQQDSETAVTALHSLLQSGLYDQSRRVLTRLGVRAPDRDDILQDTVAAALEACEKGGYDNRRGSLNSWFFVVLRNRAVDVYRRQANYQSILATQPPVSGGNEEGTFLVRDAVDRLRPAVREVLIPHLYAGLHIREIAPVVRRSPGRTGELLAEGKKELRRLLAPQERILSSNR